ncbi:ABC transporter ATP-binding protein [Flavobacteriaceae bacterium F89]|uniref:ABC transporter ATP-binding protein n=1 Tax=Cerina litoralis TaxID=2874477 RepID=A0AAE3EWW9_9FLAO|nr:ABC transporter ATP-binding protein [Cerina litoralis]MCG2462590.1 ABC transporter ATP-binding protein [Cerina litoralis]
MKPIIKIENVSKQYRLGLTGTGTFSHDVNRWWHNIRGKEDPYLKIGEANDRSTKGESDYVWALRDINFEVMPGEVLGIIGKNGAGKSTLLKLLSRVTAPTTGSIKARGRIASLLEVGTGFHPELTGRENVFLNGAIMGMSKPEIRAKFDEIVDFAGCERYIDTPVKRYSSGMYVRLAFAVAAHLEPDILVVDEVLAVGDAEFQKKAIGKMQEVSTEGGRTVLFVSHNMESVRKLCNTGIVLSNGIITYNGDVDQAISNYLSNGNKANNELIYTDNIKDELQLNSIKIKSDGDTNSYTTKDNLKIIIDYTLFDTLVNLRVIINFFTEDGVLIFSTSDFESYNLDRKRIAGRYLSQCQIPANLLNLGNYRISVHIDIPKVKSYYVDESITFEIVDLQQNQLGISLSGKPQGVIHPILEWNVKKATNKSTRAS